MVRFVHEAYMSELSVHSFIVDSDLELGSWGCNNHQKTLLHKVFTMIEDCARDYLPCEQSQFSSLTRLKPVFDLRGSFYTVNHC